MDWGSQFTEWERQQKEDPQDIQLASVDIPPPPEPQHSRHFVLKGRVNQSSVHCLYDPGAIPNFANQSFVRANKIPTYALSNP